MYEIQPSDALTAIAEIAIGLAGFAGLIVTLRNRGLSSWPRSDLVRLRFMLWLACATFFLALLPYISASLSLSDERTWASAAYVLGAGLVAITVLTNILSWPIRHQLSKLWNTIYQVGSIVTAAIVLCSAFEIIGLPTISAYLIGLVWMLFYSTSLFVRLILNQPTSSSKNEAAPF